MNNSAEEIQDTHEELVAKLTANQNRLQAYIYTLTGDKEAARDVLQATNLVIWRKARDYVPGSNFIAWAFRIAKFQVLAYRQKDARDRIVFSEEFIEELAASSDDVESEDLFEDKRSALAECLELIASRNRKVIWLRYRDGLRIRDIAERLGKSTNSIEQLMLRVRISLLRCITRRLNREAFP